MDEFISLFTEVEIQRTHVQAGAEDILKIYRNLATSWYWEGLQIKAMVIKENDPP